MIKKENWLNEYNLDVAVSYELSMILAKKMPLEKIINISSIYGVSAFNPYLYDGEFRPPLQYACAKAALIQLTKCMAVMFANKDIQVNCVSFGGIEGRVDKEFAIRYARLCPQGRMMKENEVVGVVDFLISSNSAYITGQNIVVDGGWTLW
jgi:NAD(P)-dependent dehydrogenase (short-subunit alcohol dehydrogenase family)